MRAGLVRSILRSGSSRPVANNHVANSDAFTRCRSSQPPGGRALHPHIQIPDGPRRTVEPDTHGPSSDGFCGHGVGASGRGGSSVGVDRVVVGVRVGGVRRGGDHDQHGSAAACVRQSSLPPSPSAGSFGSRCREPRTVDLRSNPSNPLTADCPRR